MVLNVSDHDVIQVDVLYFTTLWVCCYLKMWKLTALHAICKIFPCHEALWSRSRIFNHTVRVEYWYMEFRVDMLTIAK